MQRYNKATAAVIAGAIGTIVQAVMPELGAEVIAAGTTLLGAFLVWLVPNKDADDGLGQKSGV